eukprot:6190028-Pleurochrysis_carterae.AAC.9
MGFMSRMNTCVRGSVCQKPAEARRQEVHWPAASSLPLSHKYELQRLPLVPKRLLRKAGAGTKLLEQSTVSGPSGLIAPAVNLRGVCGSLNGCSSLHAPLRRPRVLRLPRSRSRRRAPRGEARADRSCAAADHACAAAVGSSPAHHHALAPARLGTRRSSIRSSRYTASYLLTAQRFATAEQRLMTKRLRATHHTDHTTQLSVRFVTLSSAPVEARQETRLAPHSRRIASSSHSGTRSAHSDCCNTCWCALWCLTIVLANTIRQASSSTTATKS